VADPQVAAECLLVQGRGSLMGRDRFEQVQAMGAEHLAGQDAAPPGFGDLRTHTQGSANGSGRQEFIRMLDGWAYPDLCHGHSARKMARSSVIS